MKLRASYYEGTVQNVTVYNGDNRIFKGYNSLTASTVTINSGGAAEFTARKRSSSAAGL